jgi:serine/threonine protein phosphatase PrpC
VINEDVIAEALAGDGSLESKCRKLIEAAKAAGGPDNITTVLLRAK